MGPAFSVAFAGLVALAVAALAFAVFRRRWPARKAMWLSLAFIVSAGLGFGLAFASAVPLLWRIFGDHPLPTALAMAFLVWLAGVPLALATGTSIWLASRRQ